MRTYITLALALVAFTTQAQITIITQNSNTFAPASATVDVGETVTFNVSTQHTATQVSEETWMVNGNTPLPGGFNFGSGMHEFVPASPGTIYFVCIPHAGMGMKGQLVVQVGTSVEERASTETFRMYPNPATDEMTVEWNDPSAELVLIDAQGREVLRSRVNTNERIGLAHLVAGNYTAVLRNTEGITIGSQRVTITR